MKEASPNGSLRQRILTFVGMMVLLSLASSSVCLYRLTEVNQLLGSINHVSVPIGRLFTQINSDIEVFHRELDRCLGQSHWKDPAWRPRKVPRWVEEILQNEMARVSQLMKGDTVWYAWSKKLSAQLDSLIQHAGQLELAILQKDEVSSLELYSQWVSQIEEWKRQIQWGASEYERTLRQNFSLAESRVAELRTGMEVILVIVVLMSLLLLWLGERTLRPLGDLTQLARDITRRGLRKEDKSLLPEFPLTRSDEVSQLAREFHHMATALLEREKMVETQKSRLQEQNRLLRDMGELNENILNSIKSVLLVTDLTGKITQCNPTALKWLKSTEEDVKGSHVTSWGKLEPFLGDFFGQDQSLDKKTLERRLGPLTVEGRVFGGELIPLKGEPGAANGAILVLDDLTDELDLQVRLRQAENLAAVGKMSAQVAHEVRNPLHSIGLEAEMAAECAARIGETSLKLSLHSILASVDRLQKITENYLKLSRLSGGQKSIVDLGTILESVLATYAPVCEAQGVQVNWSVEPNSSLKIWADPDLIEQVLGNLFRNSLQALEEQEFQGVGDSKKEIHWRMGNSESNRVWLTIEDSGPGIPEEIKPHLFNPFVTSRAQGTGLGLSFIKKVVEDHGGAIRVLERSRANPDVQMGACFEMTLPLLEQTTNQDTKRHQPSESSPPPFKKEIEYAENITR